MKYLSRSGYTCALISLAFLSVFLHACSRVTAPFSALPDSESADTQLSAQASATHAPASQIVSADDCPSSPASLPEEILQKKISGHTYAFNRFDYAPRSIIANETMVRFSAREYDFVYCLKDDNWSVQPGTLGEEWLAQLSDRFITPAEFSSLEVNGQTYQYRVVRDPNPEATLQYDSVTLELGLPGQESPQRHMLYTLADVQQASGSPDVGPKVRLGIPYVTNAVIYGVEGALYAEDLSENLSENSSEAPSENLSENRLWLTVAFKQDRNNSGISTIISYDLATGDITLIQPNELWSQQILNLALTGDPAQPTLWMGVQKGSESISSIPASGLVSYRPDSENLNLGTLRAYTPYNSPLVGAIPTQLAVEGERLWVGTRNGVCGLAWQAPEDFQSWDCWQFIAEATISPTTQEIPVYSSLLSQTPTMNLPPTQPVEVLWWMLTDTKSQQGRYEVKLHKGLDVTVEQGASPILEPQWVDIAGRVPMFWPGYWWHWQDARFVRPLDHHLNTPHEGDRGIGPVAQTGPRDDWYAMRGDLELVELSANSARVKHYSGWVDDSQLSPFPKVIKQSHAEGVSTDPLVNIDDQLRNRTRSER